MRPTQAGIRRGLLGTCLLLALLAYRRPLLWDPSSHLLSRADGWLWLPFDTSPQVVFLFAAALLYLRRKRLADAMGEPGPLWMALPLFTAGVALFLWGHYADATDLVLASFLPVALGAALLLFGGRFARTLALPVLFLGFAIPAPGVLANQVVFPLQLSTAAHTEWWLNALGVPAVLEGDVLYLADQTFEVIETCSGVRSIEVLTMLAVAWVGAFPITRWHGLLLVACALPIAYLANLVRVLSLIWNPQSDLAAMHTLQGVSVFLGGLALLVAVDSLLRRTLYRKVPRVEPTPRIRTPQYGKEQFGEEGWPRVRLIGLAALLGTLFSASLWAPRWQPPKAEPRPSLELPVDLTGWSRSQPLPIDPAFLWTVRFSQHEFWHYVKEREAVDIFVAYDDRLDRRRSALSPKNAFPSRGWLVEEEQVLELEPDGFRVRSIQARSGGTRKLSYLAVRGTDTIEGEILRAWMATDQSFLRRPGGMWVLRLSTEVKPYSDGVLRARRRLRQVLKLVRLQLPAFREAR